MVGSKRIVVGFSGGVTSAWCLYHVLQNHPREQVVALFHDTKSEDEDTYRFISEMADYLGVTITERSDGRSVDEVEDDEGMIANDRVAFCSRILKAEQKQKYLLELRTAGVTDITLVLGFSAHEYKRIQRTTMVAERDGYKVMFPLTKSVTHGVNRRLEDVMTKQQCYDWVVSTGVKPPRMYCWSSHANCVGCRRGKKNYWLAVLKHRPDVYQAMIEREEKFQHTLLNGMALKDLLFIGLRRPPVKAKESIEVGSCECGE